MAKPGASQTEITGPGIDEDTAIVMENSHFRVIGSGAVYVADGAGITHSNIAEAHTDEPLSLSDVRLHVLSAGDAFDLKRRQPQLGEAHQAPTRERG